jgi:VWFA-related protein
MFLMGLFFILLLAGWPAGQEPPAAGELPVFRTGVSFVRLDAQVEDGRKLIADLGPEDFVIRDEGIERKAAYFGRASEPVSVLLLLDVSGSMKRYVEEVAAAAKAALAQMSKEDQVGVMVFARKTKLRAAFTRDHAEIARELRQAAQQDDEVGSATLINSAVIEAAGYIGRVLPNAGGRRSILILTDNNSMGYKTPDGHVLWALWNEDTVLNAIVTGKGYRPPPPPPGKALNPDFTPADVFVLAEQTGGEAVKTQQAGTAFREMLERIRTRYSLHYHLPEGARPGSFRTVRVDLSPAARLRLPTAVVRTRRGYYVPE